MEIFFYCIFAYQCFFVFIKNGTVFNRFSCGEVSYNTFNSSVFNRLSDLVGIGMPEHGSVGRDHICI